MSVAQTTNRAPCRFRREHPTVKRPASRLPLIRAARERAGALCVETRRGVRARNRVRLRDTRYRRPAASNSPPRRTS
jgi:hypothetical protein